MSEYYAVVREGQDDHLEHLFGFGKKKGSQKKNHKYLARIQSGKGWRYIYNAAELAAYKAGGAVGIDKKKDLDKKFRESERIRKGIASKRGKYNVYNPDDPIERARNAAYKRSTEKVIKARDAYDKTLLGKAEVVGDVAKRAGNAAGNAAKKAGKSLRNINIENPIKIKTVGGAAKAVGNAALKKNPIGKAIDKKFAISRDAKIAKRNAESKKKFLERAEFNRKSGGKLAEAHTNEFLNKPKRIERRTREATGASPNLHSGDWYYDEMAQNKGWRNLHRDSSDNAPWRKAHNNYARRKKVKSK